MTLTGRDRKLIIALIPIALVIGYWFLLLAPKRAEETKQKNALTAAQGARDTAAARYAQLSAAKRSFSDDYQTVIKLGKSIPATLDMPSLMVQLNAAAAHTGIEFTSVQTGDRSSSGAASSASSKSGSSVPGLDSVPLTFEFNGDFFRLADFFHAMKRLVQVVNNQIEVRGRLMTIDSFSFKAQPPSGNRTPGVAPITASVQATVYLAPKADGLAAGATAQGPAASSSSPAPATSQGTPAAPAAAVTR